MMGENERSVTYVLPITLQNGYQYVLCSPSVKISKLVIRCGAQKLQVDVAAYKPSCLMLDWFCFSLQVCGGWFEVPEADLRFLNWKSREGDGTPLQHSRLKNPMDGRAWWSAVHGVAKIRTRLSDFTFSFHFHSLEKEMATHSSVLAWRIPGTGEPGGLSSMGVGHDWSNLAVAVACLDYC